MFKTRYVAVEWVNYLLDNNVIRIRDNVHNQIGAIIYNLSLEEQDSATVIAGALAGITLSIRSMLEFVPAETRQEWVTALTDGITRRPPISKNLH